MLNFSPLVRGTILVRVVLSPLLFSFFIVFLFSMISLIFFVILSRLHTIESPIRNENRADIGVRKFLFGRMRERM